MKKILYAITSLSHKRVFESFEQQDDIKQMLIGPYPKITSGIVPEDYGDFKIKKIKFYSNKKEQQDLVNFFIPDIYVEGSLPVARGIKLPPGCKKIFVNHGMLGAHVQTIIKEAGFDTSVWKGCDLYCGASQVFYNWIKCVTGVEDNKILLNALPQLDILKNPDYYESYKQRVMARTKNPSAKKVVLFFGFQGKDRSDFTKYNHNEDYYWTAIALEELARKNNWLVMIKPRQFNSEIINFLTTKKWGSKYINPYRNILNSKFVHFITTTGHIYRYFFADCFVYNGCTTAEIEACCIKKPLIAVRTHVETQKYDPFYTVGFGASKLVSSYNKNELEESIINIPKEQAINQQKLLEYRNIIFDGRMWERAQNKILEI